MQKEAWGFEDDCQCLDGFVLERECMIYEERASRKDTKSLNERRYRREAK